MRKKPQAIDGFIPRTRGRSIGSAPESTFRGDSVADDRTKLGTPNLEISTTPQYQSRGTVSRREIDDSLKDIDDEEAQLPKKRGLFGRKKNRAPKSRRRRVIGRIIKVLIILAILVAAFVGIRAFIASNSIFKGNIFDFFQNKPLKMDQYGRTNILIYGTSGSATDETHPGANLTDSILVMSVDQNKKNAYMMSIPRDLWVDMGGSCSAGYQAKINALYECHSDDGKNEGPGASALQKKVGDVTGLDLQYYVHVNWSVLISAVNAVGGVDVDVKGDGPVPYGVKPGSILDRNFDMTCHYNCYYVKYSPGVHHLDGVHALALSRARNANGGYGLQRANYDREVNQQKILVALKNKATSAGTLTNVGKVTSLIDALGKNLHTNFQTSEIQTLMRIGQDVPSDQITSLSFVDHDPALVTNGNIGGQSIVQPTAGLFDYTDIRAYIRKSLNASKITKEDAHVALFNGSRIEGYAKTQSDKLTALGFNVTATQNAPSGDYKKIELYDLTSKKPATRAKLEQIYGVTVNPGTSPVNVSSDTDFVVIYGKTSDGQ